NYIYHDLGPDYFNDWSEDFINTPDSSSTATALLIGEKLDEAMASIGLPLWEGSNGWVLSPKKTKSGKAILANDTHIGFSQPAVWYEAHINYPGYDFYGSFLPTCPYAVIGHNKNLAWGLTIFPFDNMDYYQVEETQDPSKYLFFGDTVSYETENITIAVKDAADEVLIVKKTKFGPIINHIEPIIDSIYADNIALSWAIFHLEHTAVEALYRLNQAQDLNSFKQALPLVDIVGLNVMYADVEDNIAWWACGKIPIRDSLSQSFTFLNSNASQDKTGGFQNFSKNPFLINPPSGYIVTANNNPVLSGSHFERGSYLPSDRVERISSILEERNDWDIDACKSIQLDHTS
ncbi:MAG: penicillin acylase family protein, partial [Bacteroidales bacterium]|nr:penicillin acylase family protein [Bacteroidales bacterium]